MTVRTFCKLKDAIDYAVAGRDDFDIVASTSSGPISM